MRKKGFKSYIPWIVLAFVALALALLPTLARNAMTGTEASILSVTAETGEIENTLAGGGTLTAEDPIEVKIPSTVEITEFLVENGDLVREGQSLAKVNRVTLLGAMTEVQQSMDEVALRMQEKANVYSVGKLTAQVNGRVKAIYAAVGDDVRMVTMTHGSVAVLSLDGLMVAEIQTKLPIRAGERLTVLLPDGTEVPGRVENVLEGKLRVTLSDDGPRLGDTVTVRTAEGEEIGSGILEVHSPWKLLATDGTVNYVYVKENQKVWVGNGIVSVEKLSGSTEYHALAAKHREYEKLMQRMFALYGDDNVKAPSTGFVSGIDEKLIKGTAAEKKEYEIKLLADETATASILVTEVNGNTVTGVYYTENMDLSSLSALLSLLSSGNISFAITDGSIPTVGDIVLIETDQEGNARVLAVTGHVEIEGLVEEAKTTEDNTQTSQASGSASSGMGFSGMIGGFSVSVPQTSGGTTVAEEDNLYDLQEKTILSVIPDSAMTVSISVDELDILQYELGMKADITVDALPDRSFTAEVIEIGGMGENDGGNSKYKVKLRLDRAPDMLDGMNASVVVHRGSKSALLLPAAAIHDRGSRSYVYTALDSKTGKPVAELAVTTGISDGETVEILSGLAEGQPVFYEYYLPVEAEISGK